MIKATGEVWDRVIDDGFLVLDPGGWRDADLFYEIDEISLEDFKEMRRNSTLTLAVDSHKKEQSYLEQFRDKLVKAFKENDERMVLELVMRHRGLLERGLEKALITMDSGVYGVVAELEARKFIQGPIESAIMCANAALKFQESGKHERFDGKTWFNQVDSEWDAFASACNSYRDSLKKPD